MGIEKIRRSERLQGKNNSLDLSKQTFQEQKKGSLRHSKRLQGKNNSLNLSEQTFQEQKQKKRNVERDEHAEESKADKKQKLLELKESRLLPDTPRPRWQGPAHKALEQLLQEVAGFDRDRYEDMETLEKDIYNLCVKNDQQQGFSEPMDDQQYTESLLKINPPQGQQAYEKNGWYHFHDPNVSRSLKINRRRIALNIQPDQILNVTKDLVQEICTCPYVYHAKVAFSVRRAAERLDPFIIYFSDPPGSGNKEELEQLLRPYAKDTRPSHPVFMEPIDTNIQGIAFADESKGSTLTYTRVSEIMEALCNILDREEELSFEVLQSEVELQFKKAKINPYAPQWNIRPSPFGRRAWRGEEWDI